MPRYFFNLTNGTAADTDGEECADLDGAKSIARQTARELARNSRMTEISGVYVGVTDEHGKELFRTPLAL